MLGLEAMEVGGPRLVSTGRHIHEIDIVYLFHREVKCVPFFRAKALALHYSVGVHLVAIRF